MKLIQNSTGTMTNRLKQQELVVRLDLLADKIPSWAAFVNFFIAVGLVSFVTGDLSLQFRIGWLVGMTVLTVIRSIYMHRYKITPTTIDNVNMRISVACVIAFSIALTFGVYKALAISEDNLATTYIVLILAVGLLTSAAVSIGHILPIYLCFTIPIIAPIVIRLFSFDDSLYHWYASMVVLFTLFCLHVSRSISASVTQSIEMRYENRELLSDLQLEKRRTHELLANLQLEKSRAEEALHREAQANVSKSRFLAAASHDLRQPLNSLRLFTSTLELQTRDTQHRALASQIDASVESLEELFNVLLDISKLDAGTLQVVNRPTDLNQILKRIADDFKPLAIAKNISFYVSSDRNIVVSTDALLLERLLRNLVNNAVRYTSEGSVRIETSVKESSVNIAITDTGLGISTEDQVKIYEEFVQLDNPSRDKDQGMGLGLSIVKRIADLLEIPITLNSEPGIGSTFSLSLELSNQEEPNLKPVALAQKEIDISSVSVLIIDDDQRTCTALEGLLEAWGASVIVASSGKTAVTKLHDSSTIPDIILSDYRLKNYETGGDAIHLVREFLNKKIPAIILTGDISPERLKDIRKLDCPLLHKPCKSIALRQLIAQEVGCTSAEPSGYEKTAALTAS